MLPPFKCNDCEFNADGVKELEKHVLSASYRRYENSKFQRGAGAGVTAVEVPNPLPADDPKLFDESHEVLKELSDNEPLRELVRQKWRYIRTQMPNSSTEKRYDTKIYNFRITNPTADHLKNLLLAIHNEQTVSYKYNL
jgi:hypothetical protein